MMYMATAVSQYHEKGEGEGKDYDWDRDDAFEALPSLFENKEIVTLIKSCLIVAPDERIETTVLAANPIF